jgi:D-alanyl-D-alanine dipeptidase
VTPEQQANREVLEGHEGSWFRGVPGEWWHFDGPGAKEPRPILDVPVA